MKAITNIIVHLRLEKPEGKEATKSDFFCRSIRYVIRVIKRVSAFWLQPNIRKHNKKWILSCMYNWNKLVVSQSFSVSIIINELFPGTVSVAVFCSFNMIVTLKFLFLNIVCHLIFQASFYQVLTPDAVFLFICNYCLVSFCPLNICKQGKTLHTVFCQDISTL